jgi:hypothetical protein
MRNQVKNKTTYYHLIVDKSGSMSGSVDLTLSTINEQLQTIRAISQKTPDQKILTGITFFDTDLEHLNFYSEIDSINPITTDHYKIGGMTALLDAIGKSVIALESRVKREVQNGEASVVIVVLTDGYENSSSLFTFPKIKTMIQELEATGLWSFTYLGADLKDISEAHKMGFSEASAKLISKEDLPKYSQVLSESMHMYVHAKEIESTVKPNFLVDDE